MSFAAMAHASPAGETPWVEVMPEVNLRLISTDTMTLDGTTWVGLEIDMPDTYKTYWRVPGESGIPPTLAFSTSGSPIAHEIAWPFPRRETEDGYLDHAYYGHTVLPVELEVESAPLAIEANATLGICSDVCVPVSVQFSHLVSFAAPDRGNMLRMQQARAEVPLAVEAGGPFGDAHLLPEERMLVVELSDPAFDPETTLADIAGRSLLFGHPTLNASGDQLHFPLLGRPDLAGLHGAPLHLSFMAEDGPHEVVRTLSVVTP